MDNMYRVVTTGSSQLVQHSYMCSIMNSVYRTSDPVSVITYFLLFLRNIVLRLQKNVSQPVY